jgi:hypothetical protein
MWLFLRRFPEAVTVGHRIVALKGFGDPQKAESGEIVARIAQNKAELPRWCLCAAC